MASIKQGNRPASFFELLSAIANKSPEKTLLIDGDYRVSYAGHRDRLAKLCKGMGAVLGLGQADRFSVLAANNHRYIELWHAAICGAGVINPLNTRLTRQDLLREVNHAESSVIFCDAA